MKRLEERETTWTFRVVNKIAQRTQIRLEENTTYWAHQLKTWFYGYKTPNPIKGVIWGMKVDLDIRISPPGIPTDTLPIIKKEDRTKNLSADKRKQIDELRAKIAEIKASIPADPDEELENRYWDYIDRDLFWGTYLRAVAVWNRETNTTIKYQQIGELLVKMHRSVYGIKLPDELMRNDTKFYQMVIQMSIFVEEIEMQAETDHIDLPQQLHELSAFVNRLHDSLVEQGNKMFGIKRAMTDEQSKETSRLVSIALDPTHPIDERLEILDRLCNNPLVDTDNRLDFLEKSIELIQYGTKRPKPAPCPYEKLIKRHLLGISLYLQKIEQSGFATWRKLIAKTLFDSLKRWREDAKMETWTKEQFAEMLYLTSAKLSTIEQKNGNIDYMLELFFLDKEDSFCGHLINVSVQNEVINDISLVG